MLTWTLEVMWKEVTSSRETIHCETCIVEFFPSVFFGFFYIVSYIVYYNYVYVEDILRNYNHYLMVLYMLIHSLLAKKNNY